MVNNLYRGLILPADESPDGETPTVIELTLESNGYAIWRCSCNGGEELVKFLSHSSKSTRDSAIEEAVRIAVLERAEHEKSRAGATGLQ